MFNFGGSKSSSQSSSYGYNESFSDSLSQASSRSDQRIAFEDIFKQLYTGAAGATGKAAEMAPLFQGQAADLYSSGVAFLDRLGVGAGEDYLQSRLTDTSARDAQLDVLGSRMGELFREELNPAITARHVAGGTLGGGRQGVAQGQAIQRTQREFAAGATDILSRDQAAKDAAAGTLMSGRTQAAGVGLSALPSLMGIAEGGLNASLSPYAAFSQVLGGPTVLGSSSSEDIAAAISRAFGEDFSSSSSKSKSLSFGL